MNEKEKETKAIQVVRSVAFFIGFIGVILVVLGFWYDTKEAGGVLCAVGLLGIWQHEIA